MPAYRASPRYVREVNITHVTNVTNITTVINNPNVERDFANRKFPHAVTVVPAEVIARRQPVGPAATRLRNDPQVREIVANAAPARVDAAPPVTAPPRHRGRRRTRRRDRRSKRVGAAARAQMPARRPRCRRPPTRLRRLPVLRCAVAARSSSRRASSRELAASRDARARHRPRSLPLPPRSFRRVRCSATRKRTMRRGPLSRTRVCRHDDRGARSGVVPGRRNNDEAARRRPKVRRRRARTSVSSGRVERSAARDQQRVRRSAALKCTRQRSRRWRIRPERPAGAQAARSRRASAAAPACSRRASPARAAAHDASGSADR